MFDACLEQYSNSDGHTRFWPELAKRFGFKSGEELRDKFKKERKKRGIPARDSNGKIIVPAGGAPKILVFDIETSFITGAIWQIGKQHVNKSQILDDWFILSYAAKWLYEEEVFGGVLTSKEALQRDDKRLAQELYKLFDSADILISYNGNMFDIPRVNTRLLINGIQPPSSYKSIDVYQTISRNFSFTSKSMDYVNYQLNLERKKETDIDLWKRSVAGDEDALKELNLYNLQDVVVLQEQYLAVRPWIKSHPNVALWYDSKEVVCPYCGSADLAYIDHSYSTPSGLYRGFRCNHCHGVGRTQEQLLDKEKRKSLVKTI